VVAALVRNPFEVVKQQMQAGMHESAVGAVRSIVKADGFIGLYNGYSSLVMREIPFDMMQFVIYEKLKKIAKREKVCISTRDVNQHDDNELKFYREVWS
jgi:solute carrier family 25 S-adenosylmethionine transporter 26